MSWLDIVIFAFIIFGIIRGYMKGLVLEVSSLIGIIIGIVIARIYYTDVAGYIKVWFDIQFDYAKPVAFISIFFIVATVFHLLAILADKFIKLIALGWLNRILGSLFGAVKLVIILSIVINVFQYFNNNVAVVKRETIEKSLTYEPVRRVLPLIMPHFMEDEEDETLQDKLKSISLPAVRFYP